MTDTSDNNRSLAVKSSGNNNDNNSKNHNKPGRKLGLVGSRHQPAHVMVNRYVENRQVVGYSPIHSSDRTENVLSEKEMEDKYNTIRLAIRTDGLTLKERMQHHRSQRDAVESNLGSEVNILQSCLMVLVYILNYTPILLSLRILS